MSLFYDARFLPTDDYFDGVGRYSYELAHAINHQSKSDITWLISDERQIEKLPSKNYLLVNQPSDILKEIFLPLKLNKLQASVVYSPFYLMGFGLMPRHYKLILTIHDMIYFTHRTPPQWLPFYQRVAWWLFNSAMWPTKLLLKKASSVATVSETVADELHARKMTKQPIIPVLNATAHEKSNRKNHPIDDQRHKSNDIIYMGAFTPYKNVELLIDSMAALPECRLHLLSRIPASRRKELEDLARKRAVQSHIVFHDGISDQQYHQLLKKARCLVTASKAEGFGLPILEAQELGVPVACSDTPIFREVAGDSAVFFDPASPSACATAIRSLSDSKNNQTLAQLGYQNFTRFSWQKSATAALEIIENIS